MKQLFNTKVLQTLSCLIIFTGTAYSQCTTLGQTSATAFPVCGASVFHQSSVPLCTNNSAIYVPGCGTYPDSNPFYYKFTCFTTGTLGFVITPLSPNEDYDWHLWDVTGHNPNDIYTDTTLTVTANWSGTYAPTGTSSSGVNYIQCGSNPPDNTPTFAQMPVIIAGHNYVLLVSHYTPTQSGYDLSFGGGTAVITNPTQPQMLSADPNCNGQAVTLKLNKNIRCNSLSADGSEFIIMPEGIAATGATTTSCSSGFDFDEVTITLASAMLSGSHQLVIKNGSDGNTLYDLCTTNIPVGQSVNFDYFIPQPIHADSVGKAPCAPDSILVYYPKKIKCSSISASGGDFSVSGPTPVTVIGAHGNCINDESRYIAIELDKPIYTNGTYTVTIQPGIDGSPVLDVCGQPILPDNFQFVTSDTVNADFTFFFNYGCQRDTLTFVHDGAHSVNYWNWIFNNGSPILTPTHNIIFPASSTNTIQLVVSNGVCSDRASTTLKLDNEVKAAFTMPSIICPEDKLEITNNSTGAIDSWRWNYDVIATSNIKDPLPFLFPTINKEAYYTVKLVATNSSLGCSDSARKTLTVLDFCLIDVPTAFTPNNDGLNDYLQPHNALKADNYEFKVYNRWGQLIFHSNNWRDKWDGKINGILQPTAVYVWMLRYTNRDTKQPVFKKGTVALIR